MPKALSTVGWTLVIVAAVFVCFVFTVMAVYASGDDRTMFGLVAFLALAVVVASQLKINRINRKD